MYWMWSFSASSNICMPQCIRATIDAMIEETTNLQISSLVSIPLAEIELTAIRAAGPGGQHVNKVSSAIHLRFDISASSLPEFHKERLLNLSDQRVSGEGVIVIKAQRFRSQEKNREEALSRLADLIRKAVVTEKKRRPTKPSRASKRRRLDSKTKRGKTKALRSKVSE